MVRQVPMGAVLAIIALLQAPAGKIRGLEQVMHPSGETLNKTACVGKIRMYNYIVFNEGALPRDT